MAKFVYTAFISVALAGFMSGCSIHNPETAEEMRQFKTGFVKGSESFTVDRPYKAVKHSLIAQSKKCLNIETSSRQTINRDGAAIAEDWVYHPKVEVTKNQTTLILQKELVGGNMMIVGNVPQGGTFAFVLDATPDGRSKTHIEFNWFKGAVSDSLYEAIMGWVKEGATACQA